MSTWQELYQKGVEFLGTDLWRYLLFIGLLAAFLILFKIVWSFFKARISRTVGASKSDWDDQLFQAVQAPVRLVGLVLAVAFSTRVLPSQIRYEATLELGIRVVFIFAFVWMLQRALTVLARSKFLPATTTEGTRKLIVSLVSLLTFAIGILIILDTVGISITPILASLGVGSVAVALAMQDTLGNLFAGFYILIDRPVNLGDTIRLDADTEGTVQQIGWRSTRILLGANNTVIIPNSRMASSSITNYNKPTPQIVATLSLGVAYGSDLESVEKVLLDEAKKVLSQSSGADASFAPQVRFTTFADSSVNLNLVFRIKNLSEKGNVIHDLMKSIHRRFAEEKIEIPYPQRVLHTKNA